MRFSERGPSIPNHLLDARDAGDAVFICGAGVSIPAGLPDFFKLTTEVARRLGIEPSCPAGALIEAERTRRGSGAVMSLQERVSFDRIFTQLKRMFSVAQVEKEVLGVLTAVRRPNLEHHRALLDLARGPDGRRRLITTNFDRLFQKAQPRLHTYTAPHFPDLLRPAGFDGVVHLHGVLPSAPRTYSGNPLGLVLSSGDFGRAYLADAWAIRFICDLLDRHIVVLLGYSAEDPPVNYLLQGLNLSGRIRERRLYAFAAGEPAQVEADWSDRGVSAIVYDPAEHHKELWNSIFQWAERARDPVGWRTKTVALATSRPHQLKPYERGQVAALCSSTEGTEAFASATPPPPADWLCVFDAACRYWKPGKTIGAEMSQEIDPLRHYRLDDDPARAPASDREARPPGVDFLAPLDTDDPVAREASMVWAGPWSSSTLNARLFQMSRWIQSVMASPIAVWWLASRGNVHPFLHERLSRTLDTNSANFAPVVRQAWRLALEAAVPTRDRLGDGWWGVEAQVKNEGWTSRTLREFACATRPRLTVRRPWSYAPIPPDGDTEIPLSRIGQLDVNYPMLLQKVGDVPDQSLVGILEKIRENLILAATLEREIGKTFLPLPTLYPEDKAGEHHNLDDEAYYMIFAGLFMRLSEFDPRAARHEYFHWDSSCRFLLPLRLWAIANPKIVPIAEAGRELRALNRHVFWDHNHSRELLWAIKGRWSSLHRRDRLAIEAKILSGPEKCRKEGQMKYSERKASSSAARLVWMQDAGLNLSRATIAKLPGLKAATPRWRDSWAKVADRSNEIRTGWVRHETDPTAIAQLPVSEVVARCDQVAERRFESLTDSDPFHGLVVSAPQRAMAVLSYEARQGNYPQRYWSRLVSAWPKTATRRSVQLLSTVLSNLPADLLVSIGHELGRWMSGHLAQIDRLDPQTGLRCLDRIIDALEAKGAEALGSGILGTSIGGVEIPSNRMGLDFAINSPTGDLAQALVNVLFARKPKRKQGLPKDLQLRVERLLSLPGEGGNHALTIIAQQLHGLFVIDPAWTEGMLLPRFDPGQAGAEAAWSGFLSAAQMPNALLFRELKTHFLAAFAASPNWTCAGLDKLGQMLVLALEFPPHYRALLTASEARAVLRDASSDVRHAALFFLRGRICETHAWKKVIDPFLRNVWPRERKFQTAETTRTLVLFLSELGDRFPAGVRLVGDFLVPSSHADIFRCRGNQGHVDLATQFPHETLTVFSKIIDATESHPPYGLAEALTRLADAAPELHHDERWQRLHRLTLA